MKCKFCENEITVKDAKFRDGNEYFHMKCHSLLNLIESMFGVVEKALAFIKSEKVDVNSIFPNT